MYTVICTLGSSAQCKIRQCSLCQRDTEFYCNTCKHDLCLQCKEKHVIDLDTMYHDVVIYCEKFQYIPIQKTCVRHPIRISENFCYSCELPICGQCEEHRNHNILLDFVKEYQTKRKQHKEIIQNIRSETIYNNCFLLATIKADIKTCHNEISKFQSEMSKKAHIITDVIYSVICSLNESFICRVKQQIEKMHRHLARIENCEHKFEQFTHRQVKLLKFLKKARIFKKEESPNTSQIVLTDDIHIEVVKRVLNAIQITERGKRKIKNESVLKLMYTSVLHRNFTVTGVGDVYHISRVTSDLLWISDYWDENVILTNTAGDNLHHLPDIPGSYGGIHTVNSKGDLIYIDRYHCINKLSKGKNENSTLIEIKKPWKPLSVYYSKSNEDFLVGMRNINSKTATINRYSKTAEHIQTIEQNNTGQKLYMYPRYITENCNGDVIVANYLSIHRGVVVVTDNGGRHRFSYTGPPSGTGLQPRGVCTDALLNILVCDENTKAVQMIDKDGHFLLLLLTESEGVHKPRSLSYDDETNLLWVGSLNSNIISVYRYVNKQEYLTGDYKRLQNLIVRK